ncbi:MAG: GNAT family N-acetyltransferase [Clostridia bacterium]|nr:GNAT family N-acetyltransferase [Clostridia bacterium]
MPEFSYHKATPAELERIWEKDIAANEGDERWVRWREEYINYNRTGRAVTFVVTADGEPVGQGTLLISPECGAVGGRLTLADSISVGNINALRIDREYRGDGHISKLVHRIEAHARTLRLSALTIGVEADKVRNISIYFHWGFTEYVTWEPDDNIPVLYYRKELNP